MAPLARLLFVCSAAAAFAPARTAPRSRGAVRSLPTELEAVDTLISSGATTAALAMTTAERMADLPHSAITVAFAGPYVAAYAFLKLTGRADDAARAPTGVASARSRSRPRE